MTDTLEDYKMYEAHIIEDASKRTNRNLEMFSVWGVYSLIVDKMDDEIMEKDARIKELEQALKDAKDIIWKHHEVGYFRQQLESSSMDCEICTDNEKYANIFRLLERK